MDKRKDPQWIDFKKMMENETGVSELRRKYNEPYLSRSSSNEEQGTFSITSFPSISDTGSCASSLSSDDNTTNIKSILKSEKSKIYLAEKYEKRVVQKRSLLHSFERPSRNIDSFVKTVLNYSGKTPEIDSDESYNSLQKPKKESSRTGRKKSTGRNTRSLSLDRDKLHRNSGFTVYSESTDNCGRYCDTKSQQSYDERISLKSDLIGYRHDLRTGVRTAPRHRSSHYQGLIDRYNGLLREFDSRQRKTINKVEFIFDKSHRDIEMAIIDMKIDLAYKRY